MARPPQTPAMIAANSQARAQGRDQAHILQSPTLRRSQYLAEALKANQAGGQNIQSGGELAARLLAQALLQGKSNLNERAESATASNADLANRQRLAAAIGGNIEGSPVEVPDAGGINPLKALGGLFGGGQAQTQQAQAPMPQAAPQPAPAPQPQMQAPPVDGALQGAPEGTTAAPQAQPAPTPAQQAHQPQPNALGATPEERTLIMGLLNSGDPGQRAQAEQMVQEIQLRQAQPAALRQEYQAINGVPGVFDPATNKWTATEGGVPDIARTQDEFSPTGTRSGTFGQRDPTGKLNILQTPPEGFESIGGRLQPVAGGPQDQSSGGNQISNERNLRGEYQKATDEYRQARAGFQKVEAAARGDSGADDIALIFGYMKTLDPGSTVREGEFATAQNTGSIPTQVMAAYNKAISGERLLPEQRNMFVNSARSQFQTYEQQYQDRTGEYISMAEQYGLNPTNVVGTQRGENRPVPRDRPAQPAGSNGNVLRQRFTPEQARAELARRRGG